MASRIGRVITAALGAGFVLWLARLKAHAKIPPPEGRWREVPPETFD